MAPGFVAALMAFAGPLLAQSMTGATGVQPKVTPQDIKKHLGSEVIACGRVVMYDCDVSTGALALDLDTPYTRRDGITVEIAREHWASSLGHGLTNAYLFAQVCASGKAKKVGSRYRILVDRHQEIEIVSPPPPDTFLLDPSAVQSCAAGVTPPELLSEVKPMYTGEAMRGKQEGLVYLEGVVRPDGSVGDIRVLVPLLPELGLTTNAVKAVKQWRFRPATLGGRPVSVLATFELKFTLK